MLFASLRKGTVLLHSPALRATALSNSSRCLATKAKPDSAQAETAENVSNIQPLPKRPVTKFARFMVDHLNEMPLNESNVFKVMALRWQALSESEKSKYAPSTTEMAKYREAVEEWKKNADYKAVRALNVQRKAKGLRGMPKVRPPQRRPPNSFAVFVKESFSQSEDKATVVVKQAAEKWRSMTDAEKQIYKDKASVDAEEHQTKKKEET